jgi:hypothetical protein
MIYCVPAADISGVDWMVRHGRSLALANAVKSAPEQLYAEEYRDTVAETILTNATADRVSTGDTPNSGSFILGGMFKMGFARGFGLLINKEELLGGTQRG